MKTMLPLALLLASCAVSPTATAARVSPPTIVVVTPTRPATPTKIALPSVPVCAPGPWEGWQPWAVVDGDTIQVYRILQVKGLQMETVTENVRLIGIDAPERGDAGAEKATEALTRLLAGSETIFMARDVSDRDRYD